MRKKAKPKKRKPPKPRDLAALALRGRRGGPLRDRRRRRTGDRERRLLEAAVRESREGES
jgi:hypothetical protein